jgi:hypothetical protein
MVIYVFFINVQKKHKLKIKTLYINKYLLLYIFINEAGIMYRYFFVFFIKNVQI